MPNERRGHDPAIEVIRANVTGLRQGVFVRGDRGRQEEERETARTTNQCSHRRRGNPGGPFDLAL